MTNELKIKSEKLAHILLLMLESTRGTQQSIVVNRTRGKRTNGVEMWADLIRHFEKGSKEVRMSVLHGDWESRRLMDDEHPNDLYGRLININAQLEGLDTEYIDQQLKMRFIAAIEKSGNNMYKAAILQYRGTQFGGAGWSLETLIELLSHVCETKSNKIKSCVPEMKGLVMERNTCTHCGGSGHNKENCWVLDPKKMPNNMRRKTGKGGITCFNCGKRGHYSKDCRAKMGNNMIATLKNNNTDVINCYIKTFIDSGSLCHSN